MHIIYICVCVLEEKQKNIDIVKRDEKLYDKLKADDEMTMTE